MASSLAGRRILVTRDAEKARSTAAAIQRRGGIAVVFPTIAFAPPADADPLHRALSSLTSYDHVVVSSPTGAGILVAGAGPDGLRPEVLGRTRLAAVGRSTAAVLERAGATGIRIPDREDGDGLLAALLADGAAAGRTLVLRAEVGRDVVIEGLREAGGAVDAVVAYRTVTASPTPPEVAALQAALPIDAALFLSPSAFDGLFRILGDAAAREVLRGALAVAIGPTTAQAMVVRNVAPGLVSPRPDLDTVLDALAALLSFPSVPPERAGAGDGFPQETLAGAVADSGRSSPPERAGAGDGFPQETLAGAEADSGRSRDSGHGGSA